MAWLVAPGAMLPVSNDPSLATIRCATPSSLVHVTALLVPGVLGFGLKEFPACCPTIATWPGVPGEGDGEGEGEGLGLGEGDGLYPPPHETAATTARAARHRTRAARMAMPFVRSRYAVAAEQEPYQELSRGISAGAPASTRAILSEVE